ncbi:MAG TPA: PilW family protein [Rhodanobacteraceae bacterium]|nr:PilW family protein [Rhodanobacteraceae bacterium]
MIHVRPIAARRRMAGLSLIEMMIALVMALIVAAGIITVFASTSSSNKVQQQMAALQEEGRFAIHSLRADLANANGTYCSNTGGNAGLTTSGLYLDALRSPTVYAKTAIPLNDSTVTLPAPSGAYSLPSSLFMRGYQCDTSNCTPTGLASLVASGVPAMGTALGSRVKGADVLTIRYLTPGSGWAIVPSGNPGTTLDAPVSATVTQINLVQMAGEPAVNTFTGTLAMLADCSNAQVFTVSGAGSATLQPNNNYASPLDISTGAAPRVFDFTKDFQTVTYFLEVVDAGNGHTTGQLVRRFNGTNQPLVTGVERLDFLYGIINANGNTEFLTADQVDAGTDASGASIPCPPDVATPGGMPATGCLWRAVQTIEVHILMDGQTPLYTLTPNEMKYIYTPDSASATPIPPTAHAIQPNADQGFPNPLLRREFTTLVALRNFNP